MLSTIARRLLLAVPTMAGVSVVVFALIRLVPGDPVALILGVNATPEAIERTRSDLGLDQPVPVQYLHWVGGMFRGDFGHDYRSGKPISELLVQTLPVTAELVFLSMAIAIFVGVLFGVVAALWQDRLPDWGAQLFSMVGISIPDYWLGVILILTLGLGLGAFPTSGFVSFDQGPLDNLKHLVLPATALSVSLAAVLTRMTRAAMLEVLEEDFIRFGRASGLSRPRVIFAHALRNVATPMSTVIGVQIGYLFGTTVIIENVFALPGLGQLILNSTLNHNYPVIQAAVLVLALLFIATNLLVDLTYSALDPRLRVGADR